jgi:hypothetical protein
MEKITQQEKSRFLFFNKCQDEEVKGDENGGAHKMRRGSKIYTQNFSRKVLT